MDLGRALERLRKSNSSIVGYSTTLEDEFVEGEASGRKAIRIYVETKKPRNKLSKGELLPDEMFGIPVDVVAIGKPTLLAPQQLVVTPLSTPSAQFRPLIGGISSSGVEPGTLGYFCKDGNGDWYGLSCAHVFGMQRGTPILQPGRNYGGKAPRDQIAQLSKSVNNSTVDAAIARLDVGAIAAINGLPPPTAIGAPAVNMLVRKSGNFTGVTYGDVVGTNTNLPGIGINGLFVVEARQGISYFAGQGDSGSLILTERGTEAIGLLVAASSVVLKKQGRGLFRFGMATPIFDVLAALGVALVAPGDRFR